MWITKDKCGEIYLYDSKPFKTSERWYAPDDGYAFNITSEAKSFPNLTFDDEPIEVEIVSKKFMDMWRVKNNVIVNMFEDDLCKEENDCNNCMYAIEITDKDCFCKSLKSYVHFPQKDCGRKKPLEPISDEDIWNIL